MKNEYGQKLALCSYQCPTQVPASLNPFNSDRSLASQVHSLRWGPTEPSQQSGTNTYLGHVQGSVELRRRESECLVGDERANGKERLCREANG